MSDGQSVERRIPSRVNDNAFGEWIGLRLSLDPRRKMVLFVLSSFGGRTWVGR